MNNAFAANNNVPPETLSPLARAVRWSPALMLIGWITLVGAFLLQFALFAASH